MIAAGQASGQRLEAGQRDWLAVADGLSSSAYGPEEAFKTLGAHTYLAVGLALMTGVTVFIISAGYRGIIEAFPHGGGGYVVASKLLGRSAGVVSGSALLVDYVLTITVSIAAAGDVIFSFLPPRWTGMKLPARGRLHPRRSRCSTSAACGNRPSRSRPSSWCSSSPTPS